MTHSLGVSLSFLSVVLGLASSFSPPIILPTTDDINQNDFDVALKILPKLTPFFGAGENCLLDIEDLLDSRSYVSDGITHRIMELKLASNCSPETKICSGIHIQSSVDCDSCVELVDVDKIQCIPDLIVDPGFILGGFMDIEDPSSDPVIQKVAQEATKFLYGHFNTTSPCPLVLKEIVRARQQAVMGFNYEFELQVETSGVHFQCEHMVKHCTNVKIHEPFAEFCPHNEQSCVLPVDLENVRCEPLNLIFQTAVIVGGYANREIDDEIIGVAKNIAPKLMSSFGVSHPSCSLEAKRVLTAKSQVVAGTNFIMDIELSSNGPNCRKEVKLCKNIKIFRPLPFQCTDEGCLTLSDTENIECSPSDLLEFNKKLAEETVKFLYHLFEVERPCLVEAKGHVISTNDDSSYKVELEAQTKDGQRGCDFVMKICKDIHVRRLDDDICPYNNRPCIIPVNLNDATCVNRF